MKKLLELTSLLQSKIDNTFGRPIFRAHRCQGCVISLYLGGIFKKALDHIDLGIKESGEIITNIRYADATVLISYSIGLLKQVSGMD